VSTSKKSNDGQFSFTLTPLTINRGLFADNFLESRLPEMPEWKRPEGMNEAYTAVHRLYTEKASEFERYNEAQTELNFIQPVLDILWHEQQPHYTYQVQVNIPNTDVRRQPDYAFFRNATDRESAYPRLGTLEYWRDVPCLGDAKRWSASLDKSRDYDENPSAQIVNYLYRSGVRWGILTNGRIWRLYEREKSRVGSVYFEVNLEEILQKGDKEEFKWFYLFFRRLAFLPVGEARPFVERVFEGSVEYAATVGERLKESVYEALRLLMNGFFEYRANNLDRRNAEHVKLVHENCLIVLYRLLFLLYAEDRNLLPRNDETYAHYSLYRLQKDINIKLRRKQPYAPNLHRFWDELTNLFNLIDIGFKEGGIPAYNGGLFNPEKHPYIAHTPVNGMPRWDIGDHRLADVIDMLAYQRVQWNVPGSDDIDYNSLAVQHLGSIYEGLLELKPQVADEALVEVLEGGRQLYKPAREVPDPRLVRGQPAHRIADGEIYLTTNRGERKATGSYYTPTYIVDYIVQNTVGVLADEAAQKVADLHPEVKANVERLQTTYNARVKQYGAASNEVAQIRKAIEDEKHRLLEPYLSLRILDPAMGSGHFLVGAADTLSMAMATDPNLLTPEETNGEDPQSYYKRLVVEHCLYGVDLNLLAVELAKLSLWLHTVSRNKALSFLDHHLRCGNSLIGARLEQDLMKEPPIFNERGKRINEENNQLVMGFTDALQSRHLSDFLRILRQIGEIQTRDAESEHLKQHLFYGLEEERKKFRSVANCWLAPFFGITITPEQYQLAARSLNGTIQDWQSISEQKWFIDAQTIANLKHFFHWELEFPEIFFDTDRYKNIDERGFDTIIGNPPYGSQFTDSDANFIKTRFPDVQYRAESYVAFMSLAIELCKQFARSSMIVPDNWMYLDFTETLRKSFIALGAVEKAISLPSSVFHEANVDTSIYVFRRLPTGDKRPDIKVYSFPKRGNAGPIVDIDWSILPVEEWKSCIQTILNPFATQSMRSVISKCLRVSSELRNIASTNYGLKAYQVGKGRPKQTAQIVKDKPFTSTTQLSEEYEPFFEGSEIDRYLCSWNHDNWIKWGEWLAEPRNEELFSGGRLLFRKVVSKRLSGTYIEYRAFSNTLLYIIRPMEDSYWSPFALLAVLNSTLIGFCFRVLFAIRTDDTFPQILLDDIKSLPIRRIDFLVTLNEREEIVTECMDIINHAPQMNNDDKIIANFVRDLLSSHFEHSVIVHDILAILAKDIVSLNQVIHEESNGFLHWLERTIGMKINDLSNKTTIGLYYNYSFNDIITALKCNKVQINIGSRAVQDNIEQEYNDSIQKINPLMDQLCFKDHLIDQIVYKLYGLTDDDISIVEGRTTTATD